MNILPLLYSLPSHFAVILAFVFWRSVSVMEVDFRFWLDE